MKFTCQQKDLRRALDTTLPAVSSGSRHLPITQNVLIEAGGSSISVTATDITKTIRCAAPAVVDEPGIYTFPARTLTEFVRTLPAESVQAELTDERRLTIRCARLTASVAGMDPEDYPSVPVLSQDGTSMSFTGDDRSMSCIPVKVGRDEIADAVERVIRAAATDDSRPVLTGIRMELQGTRFSVAAADGFRLAVYDRTLEIPVTETEKDGEDPKEMAALIPATSLRDVMRALGRNEGEFRFTLSDTGAHAAFRAGDVAIVTNLIQGTFPNYRQLMPESRDTRVTVSQNALADMIRTASIFLRGETAGVIRLKIAEPDESGVGEITITSRSESGDNRGELNAKTEGKGITIGFNNQYILTMLSSMGEDSTISADFTTPTAPGAFRLVSDDPNVRYTHVVMPMFIQDLD